MFGLMQSYLQEKIEEKSEEEEIIRKILSVVPLLWFLLSLRALITNRLVKVKPVCIMHDQNETPARCLCFYLIHFTFLLF